jgi:glutamate synthase domain-containing protein 3
MYIEHIAIILFLYAWAIQDPELNMISKSKMRKKTYSKRPIISIAVSDTIDSMAVGQLAVQYNKPGLSAARTRIHTKGMIGPTVTRMRRMFMYPLIRSFNFCL